MELRLLGQVLLIMSPNPVRSTYKAKRHNLFVRKLIKFAVGDCAD